MKQKEEEEKNATQCSLSQTTTIHHTIILLSFGISLSSPTTEDRKAKAETEQNAVA